jgi:phospholipase C
MVEFMKRSFWLFLGALLPLQGTQIPESTYETFLNELANTRHFPRRLNQGVTDGQRLPPARVHFTPDQRAAAEKIKHLIIIYQENWSFDSLYGKFPGADGLANAKSENTVQLDMNGDPFKPLLRCIHSKTGRPYAEIPADLPNGPFDLAPFIPITGKTGDTSHRFYQEQYQIHGGLMNRFALWGTGGGFTMSYYDISDTPMGKLAKEFVLCDNWFHSCYGGSMCGVLWLFAAQMPKWPNAPEDLIARITPGGALVKDGLVSSDGYAINNAEPFYPPHHPNTAVKKRLPPQTYKTIGDSLSEKGISWGWYAQGWNDALAGKPDETFPFHHQAPSYFTQFAPGTKAREEHLFDLDQFYLDLEKGTLPAVSFIRSTNRFSEHPKNNLLAGLTWCADLIKTIQESSSWKDCAIIVTYDENGGRWDHVSPPVVDRFGPATRVPAVIISPYAKRGYVDHTSYETVSILKFIEQRWNLRPLSTRDAAANNILNAFDFSQ